MLNFVGIAFFLNQYIAQEQIVISKINESKVTFKKANSRTEDLLKGAILNKWRTFIFHILKHELRKKMYYNAKVTKKRSNRWLISYLATYWVLPLLLKKKKKEQKATKQQQQNTNTKPSTLAWKHTINGEDQKYNIDKI